MGHLKSYQILLILAEPLGFKILALLIISPFHLKRKDSDWTNFWHLADKFSRRASGLSWGRRSADTRKPGDLELQSRGVGCVCSGQLACSCAPWKNGRPCPRKQSPWGEGCWCYKALGCRIRQSCVQILLLLACHLNINRLLHLFTSQFPYLLHACTCKQNLAELFQSFTFKKLLFH